MRGGEAKRVAQPIGTEGEDRVGVGIVGHLVRVRVRVKVIGLGLGSGLGLRLADLPTWLEMGSHTLPHMPSWLGLGVGVGLGFMLGLD